MKSETLSRMTVGSGRSAPRPSKIDLNLGMMKMRRPTTIMAIMAIEMTG
ncbi:MAG TPA: hypothetical protein VHF22_14065 [Planctomycetota bacterium]|nr:hypothetical protein [Planctomycetota bacterium]